MLVDELKDYGQVFALSAAGLFFVVRLLKEFSSVNLVTVLKLERGLGVEGIDPLVVRLKLEKGGRSTLALHDISGRVWAGGDPLELAFKGIERKSIKKRDTGRRSVAWKRPSGKTPYLQLGPGDGTEVAAVVEDPSDAVCRVEVRVLGGRKRRKTGQWMASGISVPAGGR